jgi:citrate synthase
MSNATDANQASTNSASSEPKRKKGVALSGVVAGISAICTVGHSGNDLHYRGYDILDLAKHATFEEVAYLLIYGELPNQQQLADYHKKLKKLRDLPAALKTIILSVQNILLTDSSLALAQFCCIGITLATIKNVSTV